MKSIILSIVLFSFPLLCAAQTASNGFRPMFNGRDLDGWQRVNTAPSTWKVEDEMLICSGRPIGELRTTRMFQNFILELEWRHMKPRGNAGIFVWADDITARGVPFHRGIEVQVLENAYGNTKSHTTHGDIFPIHGATMTPVNGRGGRRAFPTEERSRPSPQWNHYRIECRDGSISLAVNGKVVTRGTDCSPRKGYICLESEGGIVHYRNVRIKELPDTPVSDDHVAIADRGFESLYSGVDLNGWNTAAGAAGNWQVKDWVLACQESADNDAWIETDESYTDFDFIFDVRFRDDSRNASVLLRGSQQAAIDIDRDNPAMAEHFNKSRGRKNWDRFSGSLRGNQLTLQLNEQTVIDSRTLVDLPDSGPLRIEPGGPIEFANIYIAKRPISAGQAEGAVDDDEPKAEATVVEPLENPDAVAATEAEMKPYAEHLEHTDVKIEMVPIPGGSFQMGSPAVEAGRNQDEGPQHTVHVDPFWMGKHEITWDQYEIWGEQIDIIRRKTFMTAATPRDPVADAVTRPTEPYTDMSFGMGEGRHPAICMTQHAARGYCEWLRAKTGRYYRLPTEAEWEYACRAGTKTAYYFGDDPKQLAEHSWFADNSDEAYHEVGLKQANPWGLHDMHGNVAEWVLDQYVPNAYFSRTEGVAANPLEIPVKLYPRIVRGGGWDDPPGMLRSAVREGSHEDWKQQDPQIPRSIWYHTDALGVGFRVVRPLNTPSAREQADKWDKTAPEQKDPEE